MYVPDGDGFRMIHQPKLLCFNLSNKTSLDIEKGQLKSETISVRIAGVDAPEMAHFGYKSQPFAQEATSFLKDLIMNKQVKICLLRIDQYGRAVSKVFVRRYSFIPWYWSDVAELLLKHGMACVYRGRGAEYGGSRLLYEKIESNARYLIIQTIHSIVLETKKLDYGNSLLY